MRRLAAAGLVAAAALSVGSCDRYSGPTEADLLPEASLTFPGATETRRSFLEADKVTYVMGGEGER